MDIVREFGQLVGQPIVPLDEAMLVIASIDRPDLDRSHYLGRLDALAASCAAPTAAAVAKTLFADELYSGNTSEYYDERNSYLDQVLDRRVGIPISLAILAVTVAERLGCDLRCVGLPGHVLLRDMTNEEPLPYIDAFGGGVRLDEDGVRGFFAERNGGAALDDGFLRPLPTSAVLFRVLNNLKMIFAARPDAKRLQRVLELQVALPGSPPAVKRELASSLATAGQYSRAADVLESLASLASDQPGLAAEVDRLRARLN